jgi:hypothetical protein
MPHLKSRIARDILRDAGAPQGGLSDSELSAGALMDDVDRSDWPEGAKLDAPQATTEGVAKSGSRRNAAKQPGTTGEK